MKFFKRKTDTNNPTTELEPYYEQSGWKLWVRRAVGVLALLILLGLIIWAAMWVYGSVTNDNVEEEPAITEIQENENNGGEAVPNEQGDDQTTLPDGQGGETEEDASDGGSAENGEDSSAENEDEMPNTGDVLPSTGG